MQFIVAYSEYLMCTSDRHRMHQTTTGLSDNELKRMPMHIGALLGA
jgi:hypothetical protein